MADWLNYQTEIGLLTTESSSAREKKPSSHIQEAILLALHGLETLLVYGEFLPNKYSQIKDNMSLVKSNDFGIKSQDLNQRLNENCFVLALTLLAKQHKFHHKLFRLVEGGRMGQEP